MQLKTCFGGICLVTILTASTAFGEVTRWTLSDVTFEDGGTAAGFFDLNTTFSSTGVIEDWRITVSGGNIFPSFPSSATGEGWCPTSY